MVLRVLRGVLLSFVRLLVLLLLMVVVFALAGTEIFGPDYREKLACGDAEGGGGGGGGREGGREGEGEGEGGEWDCEMPRSNFADIGHRYTKSGTVELD